MGLVEIGNTEHLTGFSPTLKVMQRIDERCMPNLLAFARAFALSFPGEKLIVTEGARSRPRQLALWNAYQAYIHGRGPHAELAAVPYTSKHDEITHGTALDLGNGIGTPTTVRSQWAQVQGHKFGLLCTGASFSPKEYWHYEVATSTTRPSSLNPGSVITVPSSTQPKEDEDMRILQNEAGNQYLVTDRLPASGHFRQITGPDSEALTDAGVVIYPTLHKNIVQLEVILAAVAPAPAPTVDEVAAAVWDRVTGHARAGAILAATANEGTSIARHTAVLAALAKLA
jgi:hypothetical protein